RKIGCGSGSDQVAEENGSAKKREEIGSEEQGKEAPLRTKSRIRLHPTKSRLSQEEAPIFILGIERRCGSNYLQKLLELHPKCASFPLYEDWFLANSWLLSQYVEQLSLRYRSQRPL